MGEENSQVTETKEEKKECKFISTLLKILGVIAGVVLALFGIKSWKGKKDDKKKAESDTPTEYTPSSGVQEHIDEHIESVVDEGMEAAKSASQSNINNLKRTRDSRGRFVKSE